MSRKVIIKKEFTEEVEKTAAYIAQNSPQNARKFVTGINPTLDKIANNPLLYSKELIFDSKRGVYRYCLYMKSWKIVFKVLDNLLVFLGIIHTARHPKEILKLRTTEYK